MSDARHRVTQILQEIFIDVFDDEELVVSDEMTADDVEEWDSITHISMVVTIENRLGIKFKTTQLEGLKDVGALTSLIVEMVADRNLEGV
jgi:acyl carrier protein